MQKENAHTNAYTQTNRHTQIYTHKHALFVLGTQNCIMNQNCAFFNVGKVLEYCEHNNATLVIAGWGSREFCRTTQVNCGMFHTCGLLRNLPEELHVTSKFLYIFLVFQCLIQLPSLIFQFYAFIAQITK